MQIHYAAKRGDIQAVARQLSKGVSINEPTPKRYDQDLDYGYTPLLFAARSRHAGVEMLQYLVKAGADVNTVSQGYVENFALGLSAKGGNAAKVKYLLEAGANPNFRDKHGYSALIYAAYGLMDGTEVTRSNIVKLLLDAGASPNAASRHGESAIGVAAGFGFFGIVKMLVNAGARLDPLEWNSLMQAIALGSLAEVEEQLKKQTANAKENFSQAAWRFCLAVGDVEKARLLHQHSDELESNDLLWAVGNDHVEMVKWLISMGADPNAEGGMAGETALIVAAEYGSTECVSLLLAVDADVHASDSFSHRAISRAANAEIVRLLVNAGADIDYEDGEGYTLLKSAAEDGRENIVQTLLELGAAPDASRLNDTPLRVAVREDELGVVKLLLKAGADPNLRTLADDWYPLMDVKSTETLRVLLDAGADPGYKDYFGQKPVDHHTDSEIIMMLEQAEQRSSGRTGKAKSRKKRK